ncbi:MAG: MBL fold metallo-hydrolase [bacterium]|nr:MBL fold metallo-hydrolase [bacterium]
MEIEFFGANALRMFTKTTSFVVDDTLSNQGNKSVTKSDSVSLQTDKSIPVEPGARLLLNAPGEFEVGEVSVKATAVRGHRDEANELTATIFQLQTADGTVVIIGHVHPDVTDAQVEQIGHADVLVVPVGGHGFTLDPEGALKIIKKLSPSVVIPTYYEVSGINTEMPQLNLEDALTQLALPADEPVSSLKLKGTDFTSDQTKVVVLTSKS